jgi:hypothetical protein
LWDAIDEYRHAERIRTEVEAIRRLVEAELAAERAARNTTRKSSGQR